MARAAGFLLAALLAAASLAAGAAEVYTLALVPRAPPVTLSKAWTPLLDRLKQEGGIELRLKLFDRMVDFERHVWNGESDFMYGSPIQAVVARQAAGYAPLVRDGRPVNIGLFVLKDSPIRSLDDLAGKSISFTGNKNICSVYMQHELMAKNLPYGKEYAGSARNVVLNVLLGKADAGAVFSPELQREPEEVRQKLREVVSTPDFAPHPISAHPRVPAQAREALKRALLKLAASPDGAAILGPLRLDRLVEADYDRDYRELEKIDIKGMTGWGE